MEELTDQDILQIVKKNNELLYTVRRIYRREQLLSEEIRNIIISSVIQWKYTSYEKRSNIEVTFECSQEKFIVLDDIFKRLELQIKGKCEKIDKTEILPELKERHAKVLEENEKRQNDSIEMKTKFDALMREYKDVVRVDSHSPKFTAIRYKIPDEWYATKIEFNVFIPRNIVLTEVIVTNCEEKCKKDYSFQLQ